MQVAVRPGHLSIQAAFPLTFYCGFNNFYKDARGSEQQSVWIADKTRMMLLLRYARVCFKSLRFLFNTAF